jgi:orotidine-5'-phosphate decarboxylase
MMRAAADAARKRAAERGTPAPLVIGVTVLTSIDAATLASLGITRPPIEQVVHLAELAKASGLDGVVASPQETTAIRAACGPDFVIVTPGIRGGSADAKVTSASGKDDQSRTATPKGAIEAGSSYLVIGRPITAAPDPRAAAHAILADIRG